MTEAADRLKTVLSSHYTIGRELGSGGALDTEKDGDAHAGYLASIIS